MVYALEGLRGIAALVVALFHGWDSALTDPFRHGWLFVDLFFVISGFVMAHVYRQHLATGNDLRAFALKRFGRLYPLHVVTLLAFIAAEFTLQLVKLLTGLGANPPRFDLLEPWSVLANLLMLHGVGLPGERTYNAPSWSISTEIWAYAIFALSVWAMTLQARILAWVALLLTGLLAWLAAGNSIEGGTYFFRCMYGFFLGALLPMVRDRLSPSARVAGAMQALAAVACLLVLVGIDSTANLRYAAPFAFGALVLAVSFDCGALASALRAPVLQWLGGLSYSVYMTHYVLLVFFNPAGQALPEPYRSLLKVLYVAAVLGVSVLTYRWVEQPWRERLQQLAHRGRHIRTVRPRRWWRASGR